MESTALTPKDFASDQDIRWCPGCGDYSVLKQVQAILPQLDVPRENIVFISGIGCSSRFPYYMNTFGLHSIHGRATAAATGLKITRPDLSVWVVTGDGDALSIGGNHLIHLLRRNIDVNILLFNNEIYGLTKGQFSPTSRQGQKTKSSPLGVIDHPFNPLTLAMGADASFVARTLDRDPKHLRDMLVRVHRHKGTSFLEIYQNCNVFNDKAFEVFTAKTSKAEHTLFVNQGEPLVFGANKNKGIRLDGLKPQVVDLASGAFTLHDLWIHDEKDQAKAMLLTRFFDDPRTSDEALPRPFGVLFSEQRPCYEDAMADQIGDAITARGTPSLDTLLRGDRYWTVKADQQKGKK